MIRHIVAFQLASKDPGARQRHATEIRTRLEALVGVIPGLVALEVHEDLGVVDSNWPIVLVSEFESSDALGQYQIDPRHRAVVAWMNDGIVVDRVVVDYTTR